MSKKEWYKDKWLNKAEVASSNIKEALQIVYDALNQGQQKKVVKDEKVKALFDHYGVSYIE